MELAGRVEDTLAGAAAEVEAYFASRYARTPPPAYLSADIRAGHQKVAAVDANAFAGGFNNLDAAARGRASTAFRSVAHRAAPGARRIAVVAEAHTRNAAYLENVAVLCGILDAAGFEAVAVSPAEHVPPGFSSAQRRGGELLADGVPVDAVLPNHDLMEGVPPLVQDLAIPTLVPFHLGWHVRRKARHFAHASRVAAELGATVGIDPWLLAPSWRTARAQPGPDGMDEVADAADDLLEELAAKHAEHGIAQAPWAMLKSDPGTYGTGVVAVRSGAEVRRLNSRQRASLLRGKAGAEVRSLVVQEGVPTEVHDAAGAHAEQVAYLVGGAIVGTFWRVHADRGHTENLNRPGSHFTAGIAGEPRHPHAYAVAARLADLATAREAAGLP